MTCVICGDNDREFELCNGFVVERRRNARNGIFPAGMHCAGGTGNFEAGLKTKMY